MGYGRRTAGQGYNGEMSQETSSCNTMMEGVYISYYIYDVLPQTPYLGHRLRE